MYKQSSFFNTFTSNYATRMNEDIKRYIDNNLSEDTFKVILSNPLSKECKYRKVVINKKTEGYQIEQYTDKQVFHINTGYEGIVNYVYQSFGNEFRQYNAWDSIRECNINISKKGKILCSRKQAKEAPKMQLDHNRSKNYILKEGELIAPLVDMGIFTPQGQVIKSMYDKYRQINRFVEIIDDEVSKLENSQTLNVIDFGCGKSYLTFILYYYLTEIKKIKVNMIGLDLKEAVIENCNKAAEKYGYSGLHFELGDINGYKSDTPVDMVISLHACDTATDYALYNAIGWDAKMIFSVPCCQHELNSQIKSDKFSILTKYGIIKERAAALMTDAIRAELLECCGYKTQVMEFIDMSHTPKNILIRAVKSDKKNGSSLQSIENLIKEFDINPTLYNLLKSKI